MKKVDFNMTTKIDDFIKKVESTAEEDLFTPRTFYSLSSSMFHEMCELLKEQEPIPCGEKIKAGDVVLDFYECGCCKNAIRKPWKYCPFCGKEVKWEWKSM